MRTPSPERGPQRLDVLAAAMLLAGGATVAAIGLYFVFVRPPLLPEDFRFIGASPDVVAARLPGLAAWLGKVFLVMGGYIVATGVLAAYLACRLLRSALPGAWSAALVAGAVSIGNMAAVNFVIDSDYKWALLAVGLLWAAALLLHGASSLQEERAMK